jgi:hypothetical protein
MSQAIKLLLWMFALFLILVFCNGCSKADPEPYVQAPAQSCKASPTGQTRTEVTHGTICAVYRSDMSCQTEVPTTQEYTRKEYRVTCDFKEWR